MVKEPLQDMDDISSDEMIVRKKRTPEKKTGVTVASVLKTAAEALVREMKEESGLDFRVGKFLGVLENSFLQHGEKHCEINLVYEMSFASGRGGAETAVDALEPWIEFEWRSADDLASANLLPAEISKFIPG